MLDLLMSEPDTTAATIIVPTNLDTVTYKNVGSISNVPHIKVWVDGSFKVIPVDNESDSSSVITEDGAAVSEEFADNLCIYYRDDFGVYHLRSLDSAVDEDGKYTGIEKSNSSVLNGTKSSAMYLGELTSDEMFGQVQRRSMDNTYYLGTKVSDFESVNITDISTVLVKTYLSGSDTYEYVSYTTHDAIHYLGTIPATKVQYVVYNDPAHSSIENLLALYAEVTYDDNHNSNIEKFYTSGSRQNVLNRNNSVKVDSANETITLTPAKADNGVAFEKNISVNADVYQRIRVRMKVDCDESVDISKIQGYIYYQRGNDTSYIARPTNRMFNLRFLAMAGYDDEGWMIIDFDLGDYVRWHGDIHAIRFDPVIHNDVKYTIDYVRFIKTSDYEFKTHEELLDEGYTSTQLLMDNGFENGFHVYSLENGSKADGYFEYTGSGDETNNKWLIGPWWTQNGPDGRITTDATNRLIANRDKTTGEYTLADDKGTLNITYNPEIDSVSMTLNASKMYNGQPHIGNWHGSNSNAENMAITNRKWWPHLLIEQNDSRLPNIEFDRGVYSAASDRVYATLDMRLASYTPTTNEEGSNILQYLVYFYLFSDKVPGQRIWFGMQLFNTASSGYSVTWSRDSAAHQYMYSVSTETVYNGIENSFYPMDSNGNYYVNTNSEWKNIRVDLTPHIDKALEWANASGAFTDKYGRVINLTKEDMYFAGVNIGYEVHGNIDSTIEIKNFGLVSYNK